MTRTKFLRTEAVYAAVITLVITTIRYKDQNLGDRGSRYNQVLLYTSQLYAQEAKTYHSCHGLNAKGFTQRPRLVGKQRVRQPLGLPAPVKSSQFAQAKFRCTLSRSGEHQEGFFQCLSTSLALSTCVKSFAAHSTTIKHNQLL